MAVGIPTGFVRKLYRILDHENAAIISWDADGRSFSVHDSAALDEQILPRYFRGRLSAFRQQLMDHGFTRRDCEETEDREEYFHPSFRRGCPQELNKIERKPKQAAKGRKKTAPKPDERLSLTVKLHVPPLERNNKRNRDQEPQEPPKKKPKNPLFTNDPESSLSLATFVEGSGLLPASSDLPDPISYLSKAGTTASLAQSNAIAAENAGTTPPMFSDDMVRSAMFFLMSTSCTGVDSNPATTSSGPTTAAVSVTTAPSALTAATTSTSAFLSSLLASSATGGTEVTALPQKSNPLFNDQATDGEDSIWSLLVASSVDHVRNAIDTVVSPQEKLRLIMEEREKLEEQRKKVGAPAGPLMPKTRIPIPNAPTESSKQQNPLFATDTNASALQDKPAEDDLWRLLMSSSIDSFRRIADKEL